MATRKKTPKIVLPKPKPVRPKRITAVNKPHPSITTRKK